MLTRALVVARIIKIECASCLELIAPIKLTLFRGSRVVRMLTPTVTRLLLIGMVAFVSLVRSGDFLTRVSPTQRHL